MRRKSFIFLFGLFILAAACNSDKGAKTTDGDKAQIEAQEQLWDEVMAIHDEVMPKMGAINAASRRLKQEVSTNPELDPSLKQDLSSTIGVLAEAEEGMWDWMHNLKQLGYLRDSLDHEGIISYLETEKDKITKVKELMNSSIQTGEKYINDLDAAKTNQ